jgi:hypothetical protein
MLQTEEAEERKKNSITTINNTMECGIWYEISSNGISESAERKKKGSAR